MSNMDADRLAILRRKLTALSYNAAFEESSAPLVERLLEDLVQATESFRQVKLQNTSSKQQLDEFEAKVLEMYHQP
jgi:hypothetical protein